MKNSILENDKLLSQKVIFCTECDEELEYISLYNNFNDNPAYIRKRMSQCKKNGRFKGEFCSKLFIFHEDNLEDLFSDDI